MEKVKKILANYVPDDDYINKPGMRTKIIQDVYEQVNELYKYMQTPDFINSLKGDKGDKGDTGEQGPQGEQGKSAFADCEVENETLIIS